MGRKRHAMVDTDGRTLELLVHGADVQDRDGAVPLPRHPAPDLQKPRGSPAGHVRLRRDVLQPGAQAGQERDAVARRVRTAADFESGRRLEN